MEFQMNAAQLKEALGEFEAYIKIPGIDGNTRNYIEGMEKFGFSEAKKKRLMAIAIVLDCLFQKRMKLDAVRNAVIYREESGEKTVHVEYWNHLAPALKKS